MKVIFFFSIFTILVLFFPAAYAEPFLKTVNDKYTITKNIVGGQWWDHNPPTVEIILIDSRNNTQQKDGISSLDVIKTDFVATSKGKASAASDVLYSDSISILPIDVPENISKDEKKSSELDKIELNGNLTKFKIDIDIDQTDTATYSGKIFLKNESVLVPISLDIVVQHDVKELILLASIGIVIGIISSVLLVEIDRAKNGDKRTFKYTDNKPWVSTAVIAAIAVPSTVLVDTVFVGNNALDIIISLSAGLLVATKLLAKNKPEKPKNKLSVEYLKGEISEPKTKQLETIGKNMATFNNLP